MGCLFGGLSKQRALSLGQRTWWGLCEFCQRSTHQLLIQPGVTGSANYSPRFLYQSPCCRCGKSIPWLLSANPCSAQGVGFWQLKIPVRIHPGQPWSVALPSCLLFLLFTVGIPPLLISAPSFFCPKLGREQTAVFLPRMQAVSQGVALPPHASGVTALYTHPICAVGAQVSSHNPSVSEWLWLHTDPSRVTLPWNKPQITATEIYW